MLGKHISCCAKLSFKIVYLNENETVIIDVTICPQDSKVGKKFSYHSG
jgi:hypothetical protein